MKEVKTFCKSQSLIFWTRNFLCLLFNSWFCCYNSCFNLLIRAFIFLTRGIDLVTRGCELVARGFQIETRGFELATSVFELLIHNSYLVFYFSTLKQLSSQTILLSFCENLSSGFVKIRCAYVLMELFKTFLDGFSKIICNVLAAVLLYSKSRANLPLINICF